MQLTAIEAREIIMSVLGYSQLFETRQKGQNVAKLFDYANKKRLKGQFNDITIEAGGRSIAANRMVLSCFSKYFESMFLSPLKEQNQDLIVIQQFEGESIAAIITFIYTGKINIDVNNVMSLLATADFLQINEVRKFCFEFLQNAMAVETCLEIVKASTLYNSMSLQQQAYEYINENFDAVAAEEDFKEMSKNEVNSLFAKLDRNKVKEVSLYKAIINWTKYDDCRRADFSALFLSLDLHKFPCEFIIDEVAEELLVKNNSTCDNLVSSYCTSLSHASESKTIQTKILCIGGEGTKSVEEVYNSLRNAPGSYPDLPYFLSQHRSVKIGDYIYCIGGKIDHVVTKRVFRLNLQEPWGKRKWKEVDHMIEKRCLFGASEYNGNIVVAGGWNGKKKLNTVEHYDVQFNRWRKINAMRYHRDEHELVAAGGSLYAVGGRHDGRPRSEERLDNVGGIWNKIRRMTIPRKVFAAVNCNGFIYCIGGASGFEATRTVEKYDPSLKQWVNVCGLNEERSYHAACVLDGKIFVVGGENDDELRTIECYDPTLNQWEIAGKTDRDFEEHSLVVL